MQVKEAKILKMYRMVLVPNYNGPFATRYIVSSHDKIGWGHHVIAINKERKRIEFGRVHQVDVEKDEAMIVPADLLIFGTQLSTCQKVIIPHERLIHSLVDTSGTCHEKNTATDITSQHLLDIEAAGGDVWVEMEVNRTNGFTNPYNGLPLLPRQVQGRYILHLHKPDF